MVNKANKVIEEVIKQVEGSLGANLSEEERDEIYRWQKGIFLREITGLYGWDVIKEMFQSYADDAAEDFKDLYQKDPLKVKEELAVKHNFAFTANRIISAVLEDVEAHVQLMDKPPETVKKAAQRLKSVGQ